MGGGGARGGSRSSDRGDISGDPVARGGASRRAPPATGGARRGYVATIRKRATSKSAVSGFGLSRRAPTSPPARARAVSVVPKGS